VAECIEFPGYKNEGGYGQLPYRGKLVLAHRLAFFRLHGWWPPVVRHACDNPPCWNQAHLIAGTVQDNNADMVERGRNRGAHGGPRHHHAKLTQEQARVIRELYATGDITQSALGRVFGISQGQISYVVTGKSYKEDA
jgi:hypothetical protein